MIRERDQEPHLREERDAVFKMSILRAFIADQVTLQLAAPSSATTINKQHAVNVHVYLQSPD